MPSKLKEWVEGRQQQRLMAIPDYNEIIMSDEFLDYASKRDFDEVCKTVDGEIEFILEYQEYLKLPPAVRRLKDHIAIVMRRHPDAYEIAESEAFQDWLEKHAEFPSDVLQHGSVSALISAFNKFKATRYH